MTAEKCLAKRRRVRSNNYHQHTRSLWPHCSDPHGLIQRKVSNNKKVWAVWFRQLQLWSKLFSNLHSFSPQIQLICTYVSHHLQPNKTTNCMSTGSTFMVHFSPNFDLWEKEWITCSCQSKCTPCLLRYAWFFYNYYYFLAFFTMFGAYSLIEQNTFSVLCSVADDSLLL